MLAASGLAVVPSGSFLFPTLIFIAIVVALLRRMRLGARRLRDSLVVRGGHPALSDEARKSLEARRLNVAKIEGFIEKTYTVDGRGEIVRRGEGPKAGTPLSPISVKVEVAAEPDRSLYRKPSVEDLLGGRPRK